MEKSAHRFAFGLNKEGRSASVDRERSLCEKEEYRILLQKFFNNSCTSEEMELTLRWLGECAATSEGKNILYMLWQEIPDGPADNQPGFDAILDRIHHQVNIHQTRTLLQASDNDPVRFNRRRRLFRFVRNVAAILLLPLLGLTWYISSLDKDVKGIVPSSDPVYCEILSSVDAIAKVTLPDGSNVWLNHGSSLRYPAVFEGKYRDVELKGEGYFDVASHPDRPFVVRAGKISIMALGTSFNVMAYADEDRVETSLVKGSVGLYPTYSGSFDQCLLALEPADLAVFEKRNNEIRVQVVNDDRYYSWKDGKLVFNNEPMDVVVRKLGRWFNVDIQIIDRKLYDLTYTATFEHETLPQVMELMAIASPISYSISDRKKTGDGVFSKRKVILKSRSKK